MYMVPWPWRCLHFMSFALFLTEESSGRLPAPGVILKLVCNVGQEELVESTGMKVVSSAALVGNHVTAGAQAL